ncbi:ATP-dependent helicase HrpB [bacterium]|nr:ATP-dependent helicase HrpB [bacterium]
MKLPIDAHLPSILDALKKHNALIVKASPGSGKTTRIPPYLLKNNLTNKEIWVLVPKRLAAKMAALRVAEEYGEDVGQTIGYQFRHEAQNSKATRLLFLTEGLFIRKLMTNPTLSQVGLVILDEFHERHLDSDLALSLLVHLQKTKRPDLKLALLSATLDAEGLKTYLNNPPVVEVNVPVHPVRFEYLPFPSRERLEKLVYQAILDLTAKNETGHILVFLPGLADIRRCEEALLPFEKNNFSILGLHGDFSKEEQERIFKKSDKTKIILATNIAESSLTIDGVATVIDSGLHKQMSVSPWNGASLLQTKSVSKASAIQRAGRAGRTGPGTCRRLYTQSDFEGRIPFEAPELRRTDLAGAFLNIFNMGLHPLKDLSWFEMPPEIAATQAMLLLAMLGAIENDKITSLGKEMAALPLHPRLAKLVLQARDAGLREEGALLAAMISEDDFPYPNIEDCLHSKNKSAAVRKTEEQILNLIKSTTPKKKIKLAQCLLAAFPDRVAQRKKREKGFDLVFCTGGSGQMPEKAITETAEFYVVLEAIEKKNKGKSLTTDIVCYCPIDVNWLMDLKSPLLTDETIDTWDTTRKRVLEKSLLKYGELILDESSGEPHNKTEALRVLLRERSDLDLKNFEDPWKFTEEYALKTNNEALKEQIYRIVTAKKFKEGWSLDLPALFNQAISQKELEGLDLAQNLFYLLDPSLQSFLEKNFPTSLKLPSGRNAQIHYENNQSPWVSSRLQDFFGLKEGPKLMNGQVPLLFHLLAPNYRPVQVTSDLASFWKNTYPEVRKELSRRYPRHKWPENPS